MLGEVPSFVVNGDGKSPHSFRLSESTLSTIDQVMAGFKIVGGDFIGADSRVTRYEFMTEGEGKWRVEVEGGVYRYLADSIRPHDSDRFIEQLSSLQQLTLLLRADEQHHARHVRLVFTNWESIFLPILCPRQNYNGNKPRSYSEVNLGPEYGQLDFIGIVPDRVIIVIEFGRGHKTQQLRRYLSGLRNLFQLGDATIVPLIANSYSSSTSSRLHFQPALI